MIWSERDNPPNIPCPACPTSIDLTILNSVKSKKSMLNLIWTCWTLTRSRTIRKPSLLFTVPHFPAVSHSLSQQFRTGFPSLLQHVIVWLCSNYRSLGKCASYDQSEPAKQAIFIFIILSMIRSAKSGETGDGDARYRLISIKS